MKEKSLVKNSIYNVAYKLLNAFFPLISATYVSHILMASGVGKVSSAQNIAQYFVVLAALGIPNYGIREISKVKDSKENTSKVFSELFAINFESTLMCVFVYYILINSIDVFSNERALYNVAGLLIILNIFNVDWLYQGTEEFAYIAKRSFVVKLCSLMALLVLVRSVNDYINYALIHVMATAGNYVFNILKLKDKKISFWIKNIEIKKHLKPVFVLLCTSLAIELYTLLDTTMLTFFCTSENVGYYANSIKIVKLLITVITAIGGVLLPRMSYYYMQGRIDECSNIVNKVMGVLMYLFLPCGVGIILVADSLIPILFGESFYPAVTTLRIAALLIYSLGFSNLFGTQVLLTFDCEKKLFLCTLVGAVSNILMNAVLIPVYQQNGAAIASVISETLVTIMAFVFSKKYIKYKMNKIFFGKSLLSTLIMLIFVIIVKAITSPGVRTLTISIITGAVVYILSSYILKNPIFIELIMIMRKKGTNHDN